MRQRALKAFAILKTVQDSQLMHVIQQWASFIASLVFVALYVWSTYSTPIPGSFRSQLELFLCILFALEYIHRLVFVHTTFGSRMRTVLAFRNIADLLAFGPPILEAALQTFTSFSLRGFDMRFFKILRSLRVLRVGILGGDLRTLHLSTKRGTSLLAGANFRLFQLGASITALLFMTSAVVSIVEQLTFHKALYFTVTTLTTVGYGDIVPRTFLGRLVVLVAICVGVVLIPVQATQLYSELAARRVVRGSLPDVFGTPSILLSTRLTEVRAFSDFYAEFQQALHQSRFASMTKLVVLCNRPSFEFGAFQEAHEKRVTLVEGSAVSGDDLVTVGAEKSKAILLLADRFTSDPKQEDLSILFQVWACKSYTKTVPLFVQTVRKKTVERISPFLDPGQDVIVSMEHIRLNLLALSAVCPGASTLIGNLLKSSNVKPRDAREATLAGRRWLRAYVNGCEFQFCEVPVLKHFDGALFIDVVAWLFEKTGFVALGVIEGGSQAGVRLNPSGLPVRMGQHTLVVLGPDRKTVIKSLKKCEYVQLSEEEKRNVTSLVDEAVDDERAAVLDPSSRSDRWTHPYTEAHTEAALDGESLAGNLEEECISVFGGPPDSDSIDPDSLLCVPLVKDDDEYSRGDDLEKGSPKYPPRDFSRVPVSSDVQSPFSGHFILCGHEESFGDFIKQLQRCCLHHDSLHVVILHPHRPDVGHPWSSPPKIVQHPHGADGFLGHGDGNAPCVHYVKGSAADAESLRAAGAPSARALVYLAKTARPVKLSAQATGAADIATARSTREAVLADADALLACYGVGEESGAELTHAVVELLYTTSIEFLQPGLLLKGVSNVYDESSTPTGAPRKSWSMRAWQQREAVAEGLAEWQANPYYAAGRVTVPALMDTCACQSFFGKGLLIDVLEELSGNSNRADHGHGALLQQIKLPEGMEGRTYGELFRYVALTDHLVCIGLYRRKSENPSTRLSYVVTSPPFQEILEATDRVFVLRERSIQ